MPHPESLAVRILLTALVAFGPLSTDLYLPSLPTLVTVFGTDIATVQLTLSVFLAGFAVSQLVYGPLSDRFGRRPVILGGVVLFLAASLGCALADSIGELIAWRFVQAVGACCGPVVGRAVVRDVFGRDRAAGVLAYMAMAMAVAPAVGPALGGLLTSAFGWRANFLLLAAIAAAVLAASLLMLAETNRHPDPLALRPGRLAANYARLFRDRAYVGHTLTVAFAYSGIFAFISGSSFVLAGTLGLAPAVYGLCFGAVALGFMAGAFAAGRLTSRFGSGRMIRGGSALSALGGLLGLALALGGVLTVASVVLPMVVFIVGVGLTLPNAQAGAVANYPAMAGLASALLGFVQMAAAALVGVGVGALHDGTALPMMASIAVLALAAAAAHRGLVRHG